MRYCVCTEDPIVTFWYVAGFAPISNLTSPPCACPSSTRYMQPSSATRGVPRRTTGSAISPSAYRRYRAREIRLFITLRRIARCRTGGILNEWPRTFHSTLCNPGRQQYVHFSFEPPQYAWKKIGRIAHAHDDHAACTLGGHYIPARNWLVALRTSTTCTSITAGNHNPVT